MSNFHASPAAYAQVLYCNLERSMYSFKISFEILHLPWDKKSTGGQSRPWRLLFTPIFGLEPDFSGVFKPNGMGFGRITA